MTKENIHPIIRSRIRCQDPRWMSEYWWSWKLRRVPFSTSLQWRWGRGAKGGLILGLHGEAPFSIFRVPVFCAKSQKEINLTLKHWGLHLFVKDVWCCLNDYANSSKPTCSWHSVSPHSLDLGLKFTDTWVNPARSLKGLMRIRLEHSDDLFFHSLEMIEHKVEAVFLKETASICTWC